MNAIAITQARNDLSNIVNRAFYNERTIDAPQRTFTKRNGYQSFLTGFALWKSFQNAIWEREIVKNSILIELDNLINKMRCEMKSYHLFLIAVLGAFMSIALYAVAVASPIQTRYEANNAYQSDIEKGNDLNDFGKTKEAHKAYLKAYDNAVTNAQKKTALGSLAVTSFYLGNQEQSEQYLIELLSIFPNNRWAKRFAAQNNLNLVKRNVAICKTISQGNYAPS
jgi:tetratricopeptide (TPR) repeat protein